MTTRVFIDGAAGTTGLEIRDRLKDRAEFELITLDDPQRKDEAARREALHEADVAILCLPDDAAREAVALAEGSDTRIIDASSAHRNMYGWTYGFPELVPFDTWRCGRAMIAEAQFVANPGCYPTGFLALMQPLILGGLLPLETRYSVNAVSGYSGGGRSLIARFEDQRDIAFRTYSLAMGHKHLPEMHCYARLDWAPVFAPSVIPAYRGMIVEVPISHTDSAMLPSIEEMHRALRTIYAASKVIQVHDLDDVPNELVLYSDAAPWDGMELYVTGDRQQARLIARLDNLGKGASGAAIQNLNIMCGLPETTGLRL
ncbi:MAG: N-acetyl-gamma-glutamyl-phosphate reductase [Pseudomonadota bacterium]